MQKNFIYNKFILIIYMFRSRSSLYYTASGVIKDIGARPVQKLRWDCARDFYLEVWWYRMLYNKILTSRWWAHSARNIYSSIINILQNGFPALITLFANIILKRTVSNRSKFQKNSYIYSINLYNFHFLIIVIIIIVTIIIIILFTFFKLVHNILQAVGIT